ncbi:dihydrolipoamide acetyltransferase family protein [Brucellaceae bacterium C25G]
MSVIIKMPAVSPSMTVGKLVCWHFSVGDKVKQGDVIAELETDKAVMDIEAPEDGVLEQILVEADTADVPVETTIAVIGNGTTAPTPQAETITIEQQFAASIADIDHEKPILRISPLARRLAKDLGIDPSLVKGTGPSGRILAADIRDAKANNASLQTASIPTPAIKVAIQHAPISDNVSLEPHSAMRQTIARRLVEAKQTVPHFYLETRCVMDAMLSARRELNQALEKSGSEVRTSINDLMIKAYALAIARTPEAMVTWSDEGLIHHSNVDIGVAVALDNGLITPIIKNAANLSTGALAAATKQAIGRAREGKLSFEEYSGGLAGISNLGMYGISSFSAIINPPQSMNLAVGAVEKELCLQEGQICEREFIRLTLSVDHRAIDGVAGAKVLQNLKMIIENPILLSS